MPKKIYTKTEEKKYQNQETPQQRYKCHKKETPKQTNKLQNILTPTQKKLQNKQT